MPFYSSQGGECVGGMVGMINPNDEKTLEDYKKRASELAGAVTPAKSSFGGDVVDKDDNAKEKDGNDSMDGKDGDKDSEDKDGAAGFVQVPVISLVAAMGAALYML